MSAGKTFVVRRGQTAIPNATIYGTFEALAKDGEPGRLSIQSLGLLLLMLSRPNGKASMGYRALLGRGMGRDAILKAKRELKAAGLVHEYKRRTAGGSVVTDSVVSEIHLTEEEAMAEWRAMVNGDTRGEWEESDRAPENGATDRAPENGATGPETASTVRSITGARSTGASLSRESAKVSLETSSQETSDDQKAKPGEPSQSGAASSDDATIGPGRAQARAQLEERRRAKALGIKKESLRSSIDESGGRPGTILARRREVTG